MIHWKPALAALLALVLLAPACQRQVVAPGLPGASVAPATDVWEAALDRVTRSVVVIRITTPRSFDTERSTSSMGTGVVIDAERGLILTNRHMVTPGPVVAEAVFLNHEEVKLEAVYRDPVHDFGFYRFDPEEIRYMEVAALPLAPDAARVGLDIRVVGNDAGEKLSILRGTLARLDRPAPDYGEGNYNDFNTFYYQAASSTSGGSSGSPVVDREGRIVALNAGGRVMAASSFYLPLHRVVRALERVQHDRPVPRGTLQTVFDYEAYDELDRLGLRSETQDRVRAAFPERIGMLVVGQVLPGGPADGLLAPGDILVALNGELTSDFVAMESVVDEAVAEEVVLDIERNGEPIRVTLTVDDLHAITPAEYVELGGGVVHALSYQQARNFNRPVEGIYVAQAGYMLGTPRIPSFTRLLAVDGEPVEDLDAFWSVITAKADGERVRIRYATLEDARRERVAVVTVDRRWFPMRRCRRDDATGLWPCVDAPASPPPEPAEPRQTTFSASGSELVQRLSTSMVAVDFDIPLRVEGVWGAHFRGHGLVVDAERGLVVVDRDTVPVALGDLSLTFARSLRIPARVRFVHPIHNLTVLQYDPTLLGDTPVTSARLASDSPGVGEAVTLVGMDPTGRIVSRETRVSAVIPITPVLLEGRPQFRESNVEVIGLEDVTDTVGGVLASDDGAVVALWASFPGEEDGGFRGLPSEILEMIVEPMRAGSPVDYRTLGAQLGVLSLADAREQGLPETWADRLESHDPERRQALTIDRVYAGVPAAEQLRDGDLLLAVDGRPVTRFIEVERATQQPTVNLEVLREGTVVSAEVATQSLSGRGVERVVSWAGALLHEPHLEVASQFGIDVPGVFVAWGWFGSPAQRYGLRPTHLVVEIDGLATPDLDSLVAAINADRDGESLLIRTIDLDGQPRTLTLTPDDNYWPLRQYRLRPDGHWVVEER